MNYKFNKVLYCKIYGLFTPVKNPQKRSLNTGKVQWMSIGIQYLPSWQIHTKW